MKLPIWLMSTLLLIASAESKGDQSLPSENFFSDPGFENISSKTEPDKHSKPFYSVDEHAAYSVSTSDKAHSGKQSVCFNFYYDAAQIGQRLPVRIDRKKMYRISMWMMTDSPIEHSEHAVKHPERSTNEAVINIGLLSSAGPESPNRFRKTLLIHAKNSELGRWEQFGCTIEGHVLKEWEGEYITIRFNRIHNNVTHKIYLDDVSFTQQDSLIDVDGATLGRWTMDWESAKKLSLQENIPILLYFTASDWNSVYTTIDDKIFNSPEWIAYAKENLALVYINTPTDVALVPEKYLDQNLLLKEKYKISGYPSFVVLDAGAEAELGKIQPKEIPNDITPKYFIKLLEEIFRIRSNEVEKFIDTLSADRKKSYLQLIETLKKESLILKQDEDQYNNLRLSIWEKKKRINELKSALLDIRMSQMSTAERAEIESLRKQLDKTNKDLKSLALSRPENSPEDMQKYKEMYEQKKALEKKISLY